MHTFAHFDFFNHKNTHKIYDETNKNPPFNSKIKRWIRIENASIRFCRLYNLRVGRGLAPAGNINFQFDKTKLPLMRERMPICIIRWFFSKPTYPSSCRG